VVTEGLSATHLCGGERLDLWRSKDLPGLTRARGVKGLSKASGSDEVVLVQQTAEPVSSLGSVIAGEGVRAGESGTSRSMPRWGRCSL